MQRSFKISLIKTGYCLRNSEKLSQYPLDWPFDSIIYIEISKSASNKKANSNHYPIKTEYTNHQANITKFQIAQHTVRMRQRREKRRRIEPPANRNSGGSIHARAATFETPGASAVAAIHRRIEETVTARWKSMVLPPSPSLPTELGQQWFTRWISVAAIETRTPRGRGRREESAGLFDRETWKGGEGLLSLSVERGERWTFFARCAAGHYLIMHYYVH